jgi:hypothetical protein
MTNKIEDIEIVQQTRFYNKVLQQTSFPDLATCGLLKRNIEKYWGKKPELEGAIMAFLFINTEATISEEKTLEEVRKLANTIIETNKD